MSEDPSSKGWALPRRARGLVLCFFHSWKVFNIKDWITDSTCCPVVAPKLVMAGNLRQDGKPWKLKVIYCSLGKNFLELIYTISFDLI
jgi:hypothetical protein